MGQFILRIAGWLGWIVLAGGITAYAIVNWFPPPIYQPLNFSHEKHGKITCVFCHRGAEVRPRAGLPEITTCASCHATSPFKNTADAAVWDQSVQAKHIGWQKITRIQQHVYFSHQRHVGLAQLACETCHGNMSSRSTLPENPLKGISMNRCLNCHRKDCASSDCARCHK